MNRTNIIQLLINKINAKSYLEIGISSGENFEKIKCQNKIGVDPEFYSNAVLCLTSDDFFKQNKKTFDVIFIDGLHHSDQLARDIENSLSVLNKNGYIVCHDTNPEKEEHQIIPFSGGTWNGDCWKTFVYLRQNRNDLDMVTIDVDHGCSVITRGEQKLLETNLDINFCNFDKNRKEWLNLISYAEFEKKYTNLSLDILLKKYILNNNDPDNNYNLGIYYESIDQTAAALSFFLRCAERSDIPELQYECLLRASECFNKQGKRNFTVKGLLQHAISILPKRPEAYYLLSRFYETEEKDGSWTDSYMIASIGESLSEIDYQPLRNNPINYPGLYSITFQKGVAAWWCGLVEESRDIFIKLLHEEPELSQEILNSCLYNLNLMNTKPFINFDKNKHKLRFSFDGSDDIDQNYSEAFQDIFVLTLLNGKKEGTYLEIGAGDPYYGNNTWLLEKEFKWKGFSIDIDEQITENYNKHRVNKCFCKDASVTNYENLFSGLNLSKNIDYLQLDCDPPEVTHRILLSLPLDSYKFAIITYEHDSYCDQTKSFQEKSSRYLENYGYIKVLKNIAPDNHRNYEDWWVHPDLVSEESYWSLMNIDDSIKNSKNIFIEGRK